MHFKKFILATLLLGQLIIQSTDARSQFASKYEYFTQSIKIGDLGIPTANLNADYLHAEYASLPAYLALLNEKGEQGYELIHVDRYLQHQKGNNSTQEFGITLTFKREKSQRLPISHT